ncbi:hypothetical protein CQZ94_19160 [Bacillus sp. MYb209]|uniref:hypothetical protein n=1 Tax=Bacillus sp. MYb209 TaxID=1848605 RepID=UPI000CFD69A5|nr:hypothetical protein [Bacillus sp. MYb209]PQZ53970.1 hypothetical protein CQZ94_19160 [Bacillus sp. MYb209]
MNNVKIVTPTGGTLEVTIDDGKLAEFMSWIEREESDLFPISVDTNKTVYLTSTSVLLFSVDKEGN